MNYTESQTYLKHIEKTARIKLGLKVVREVVNHVFGNRLLKKKIIQVAGTNGKGSTSYYLKSILQLAGYKTGLFTSPHLVDLRERVITNDGWIKKKEFAEACSALRDISENLHSQRIIGRVPTFFEYLFLIGIYHFLKETVDVMILEVGMGGRYDATTSIVPTISVITSISYDHEEFLGSDLESIAAEKAGIIKSKIPVVSYMDRNKSPGRVIYNHAREKGAPFFGVFEADRYLNEGKGDEFEYISDRKYSFVLKNSAYHFAQNASTAIRCLEVLKKKGFIEISKEKIQKGLKGCSIPGRFETLYTEEQSEIFLDVGHNPQAIEALTHTLRKKKINNLVLVFGVLKDKKFKIMLDKLLEFVKIIIITEPESKIACDGKFISRSLKGIRKEILVEKDYDKAIKKAMAFNMKILVTGSFYLVGPVRNILLNEVNSE